MDNKKSLKIAVVQSDIVWEQSATNVEKAVEIIANCDAELLVFPEMFATGFSMSPERIAQQPNGEIVETMITAAVKHKKALIFSVAIAEKDTFYNRLFFITDNGEVSTYNKRHLFRMAGEHNNYSAGVERLIIEYRGFRIAPLVCYDLRFPVFSRNHNDYDILVYIASWPSTRSYAWNSLLRARAIENQCYLVGANRVGSDPKNEYSGDSVILDFLGKPLVEATQFKAEVVTAELELEALSEFRESFPAYLDADRFNIID